MTDSGPAGAPVGAPEPRRQARRHLHGLGRYVDDIVMPRAVHVAFHRSPHAAARILDADLAAARALPGVVAVVDGQTLAPYCTPWVGTISNLPGQKSPPQHPLAIDRVRHQGEPVIAVVAESRAVAEDALDLIDVDYEALPATVDLDEARAGTRIVNPEFEDNLFSRFELASGDIEAGFRNARHVVEATFEIGRQTMVPLEPRGLIADFDPSEDRLTLTYATQVPHVMRYLVAKHLKLEEHQVRVVAPDVGGAFGLKIHVYPDEMATAALAVMLRRPVRFSADRLESFVSDIHCRDHKVRARMGLDAEGRITAVDIDDLAGAGPYSVYPRSSGIEALLVCGFTAAPYRMPAYRARGDTVFTNKTPTCQLRGVGMPIACSVGEGLMDRAARALSLDPLEIRRRNILRDDGYPCVTASGMPFESMSQQATLERLAELMDYDGLRREQAALHAQGIHRGIGLACFVEGTSPSPAIYGEGGAPISAQDACTLRLEPSGAVTCTIGVSEQGQGAEAVIGQIVAAAIGLPSERVRVVMGDTEATPYGGGTWASRATAIGGEAALRAGRTLRAEILRLAGLLSQRSADELDIVEGVVVLRDGGPVTTLRELAHIIHFRTTEFPPDVTPAPTATEAFSIRSRMFLYTNGAMGAHVELDPETGTVTALKLWCVEDCGTVVNPMLLDGQIRGGAIQGLGAALYEELHYDREGQLQTGSMIDYLLPSAAEAPEVEVAHIETPTAESSLGAKGAGEAGIIGAPAAILNAVNDALAPFGATLSAQPATPERILAAMGRIQARRD